MKIRSDVTDSMLSKVIGEDGALDPSLLSVGLYVTSLPLAPLGVVGDLTLPLGQTALKKPLVEWLGVFHDDEDHSVLMSKMIMFTGDDVNQNQIVRGAYIALTAAPETVVGLFPFDTPRTLKHIGDQLSVVLKIPAKQSREDYGIVVID